MNEFPRNEFRLFLSDRGVRVRTYEQQPTDFSTVTFASALRNFVRNRSYVELVPGSTRTACMR